MHRRRLRERRRHHHRVLVAQHRMGVAFAGLMHAGFEPGRALAGLVAVAFAVAMAVAAPAAASAAAATAIATFAVAVLGRDAFARLAGLAGIVVRRAGVVFLVGDVVFAGRELRRRAFARLAALAAFTAPATPAATPAASATRLAFALLDRPIPTEETATACRS